MNKIFGIVLIMSLAGMHARAQPVERYLEIKPHVHKKKDPDYIKVRNSLYNKISFLDSREDTSMIGTAGVGLLNKQAMIKLRMPFLMQIRNLLDSLTDSTAANGELLFQLRDFRFAEETGTRYCYLNAGLYCKFNEGYGLLSILDTVIIVQGPDVLNRLQLGGSSILTDFLASELTRTPEGPALCTMQDIINYDSIEKSKIPAFTVTQFVDGLYYSYTAFKNQQPDLQGFTISEKEGRVSKVLVYEANGKKVRVKPKNLYAFVFKGRAYIATEFGYYPLEKLSGNLFFTGDVRIPPSAGDKAMSQFSLGLLGLALASAGYQTTYQMIIDPVNGNPVHLFSL